jgi:carbon starvation protein
MLMEGLVAITALLAATALPPADYFAINTDPKIHVVATAREPGAEPTGLCPDRAALERLESVLTVHDRKNLGLADGTSVATLADQELKLSSVLRLSNAALASLGYHVDAAALHASELSHADFARLGVKVTDLPMLSSATEEVVAARTGGAVSLAVGMARVFSGLPGMKALLSYWYHFAIMFEALFILTTIDTGTRVGRFLLQELLGRFLPATKNTWGNPAWLPGAMITSLLIVLSFGWLILSGNIAIIWPMFGIANQLLAAVALVVATTIVLREASRMRYAWVTAGPLLFVGTTTITAGVKALLSIYLPMSREAATATIGRVCSGMTVILLSSTCVILVAAFFEWRRIWMVRRAPIARP